jgi:hypothetical protein
MRRRTSLPILGGAVALPVTARGQPQICMRDASRRRGADRFDRGRALHEMRRVLSPSGRIALSVYSPIERTPGANAFVLALDRVLGPASGFSR